MAAAIFVLVIASAGLFYWLYSSYDPHVEYRVPAVAKKLEAKPAATPQAAAGAAPAKPGGVTKPGTKPAPPPSPTVMVVTADPDLIEKADVGDLPVTAPDGRTSLLVYAKPHIASGRSLIAIIIGDGGLNLETTTAAIQQLPGAITLAFSPYGSNLKTLTKQARQAGHEILLQTPMEPLTFPLDDPGPHSLLTSLPAKVNIDRLEWVMSRFTGYVGIINHMGSRFTSSKQHLQPILATLHRRGLMYLESDTDGHSEANDLATSIGMANLISTQVLDREASLPHIDAQLQALEATARKHGTAIGLASPYPVTIERLSQWSRNLATKGFDLAPVSALLRRPRK